jgi:tRNA pseudouridine55 synthase
MRTVEVYRFEEVSHEGERRVFEIECSSGTYVRSLIAELGDAYCQQLRRTRIGPFAVADADPDRVIPLPDALDYLPEVRLTSAAAERAGHGAVVPGEAVGVVRLAGPQGLVGLAEPAGTGSLKPVVVLTG